MASSRGSSQPRDQTHVSYVSCTGRQTSNTSALGKPHDVVIVLLTALGTSTLAKNTDPEHCCSQVISGEVLFLSLCFVVCWL